MSTRPISEYGLKVRQQPKYARVAVGKEKDRKPIDPPPIVQIIVSPSKDPHKHYLQNPYLILTARLVSGREEDSSPEDTQPPLEPKENDLVGTVVSSLYSLKDTDNSQGGFFVFGDLSVRKEGTYKLEFTLYELKLAERECWQLARVLSDKFQVFPHKQFPGMAESTFLTRSFSDQGVRLRLRKDSRSITTRKRNHSMATAGDSHRPHHSFSLPPHAETGSPELSPNGHHVYDPYSRRSNSLHHDIPPNSAHLDRSSSLGSQGTYYTPSPQLRGDYQTSQYVYGAPSYEDRPMKRQRGDPESGGAYHTADYGYPTSAAPRQPDVPQLSYYPQPLPGLPGAPQY